MIRRLRLGNLRKLLRDRNGPILPDDDAGREYLVELLLPISVGPHPAIQMPNAIEVWAPWMQQKACGVFVIFPPLIRRIRHITCAIARTSPIVA
jgi:hypothetical protein